MSFCKHRDADLCKRDGRPCVYSRECAEPDGKDTNVPTNADRVRAMSDEELAEYFGRFSFCNGIIPKSHCRKQSVCSPKCVATWLKQPAEVDT